MTARGGADVGGLARDDDQPTPPAYYATGPVLRRRWLGECWTLLHPPYTLWHLAYVVIGACLVGPVRVDRLVGSLLGFFLAVGIGAHALDEVRGRPLRTSIPDRVLVVAAVLGLGGAAALGVAGTVIVSPWLAAFVVVGVLLALGYNLELWGGVLHRDAVFAAAWGTFPVLTAYFAEHATIGPAAALAGAFAFLSARAQRQLSSPARTLRRRTVRVEGTVHASDGTTSALTASSLLSPLEGALRSLSWALVVLATSLALARLLPAH